MSIARVGCVRTMRYLPGAAGFALLMVAGCEPKEVRIANDWRDGCNGGDLAQCSNLGEAYERGTGVPVDLPKAAELYRKACDGNNTRGCLMLGTAYASGRGVAKDDAQASALLGKGCDNGDIDACAAACDHGDAIRCLRVGVLSATGGKDFGRAAAFFRKACDQGHPLGCRELSFMYREGNIAVAKDPDKTAEYFKKAEDLRKANCSAAVKPDYCEEAQEAHESDKN